MTPDELTNRISEEYHHFDQSRGDYLQCEDLFNRIAELNSKSSPGITWAFVLFIFSVIVAGIWALNLVLNIFKTPQSITLLLTLTINGIIALVSGIVILCIGLKHQRQNNEKIDRLTKKCMYIEQRLEKNYERLGECIVPIEFSHPEVTMMLLSISESGEYNNIEDVINELFNETGTSYREMQGVREELAVGGYLALFISPDFFYEP
jgi:hypothetical protein